MSITLSAGCRRRQSAAPKTRRAILAGSGSPSRVGGTLRYVIATPGLGDTVLPPADRCKATASHPREIDGYRGWKRGNRPALGPRPPRLLSSRTRTVIYCAGAARHGPTARTF